MIVDTSAVLAILFAEPEAQRIADAFERSPFCRFPASCFLEATITLLGRNGEEGLRDLDLFMAQSRMEISSFTESQAQLAREAFKRYGRGRHPAKLNFGDCMAYALARESGEELLFKGTDLALTDIAVAPY
jgi:ribonuclease VapC